MEAGAKFCPNCGSAISSAPAQSQAESQVQPQPRTGGPKPPLTKPLMALGYALGLVLLALGVVGMGASGVSASALLLDLVIFLVVGFLDLAAGYGVMKGRRWLRNGGLVAGVASVLAGALFVITFSALLLLIGAFELVFGTALLVYLRRPQAKQYLET